MDSRCSKTVMSGQKAETFSPFPPTITFPVSLKPFVGLVASQVFGESACQAGLKQLLRKCYVGTEVTRLSSRCVSGMVG